jgi:hypothetical protein
VNVMVPPVEPDRDAGSGSTVGGLNDDAPLV